MIKSGWNVMYLLIIEIIFGALVIFPFYSLYGKKVPLLFYFIIMITSCLLFLFLLEKFKERGKQLYFVLLIPAILIVGHVLGFSIIFSILVSFFVFWRTISHVSEQDKQNEGNWLLFSILLGILMLFFTGVSSPANMAAIGGLMIAQVLFIIIGGFLRRWLDVDEKTNNKKHFFLPFLSVLFIIGTVGMILAGGMNAIKALFFSLLNIGVHIITFITKPFFNWAESQDWSKKIANLTDNEKLEENAETENELGELGQNTFLDPTVIGTILFIAILLFSFFYIYRRKNKVLGNGETNPVAVLLTESSFIKEKAVIFRKGKRIPPTDPIRKEIFAFEHFAQKLHMGRQPFESLSEWLNRIGIMDSSDIISVYEKVRYGG
ncbi:hypothetical protein, partial [Cytobacillus massiliigabonensis]